MERSPGCTKVTGVIKRQMTRRQREGLSVEPSFRPFIFRCVQCCFDVLLSGGGNGDGGYPPLPITSARTNEDIPEVIWVVSWN